MYISSDSLRVLLRRAVFLSSSFYLFVLKLAEAAVDICLSNASVPLPYWHFG